MVTLHVFKNLLNTYLYFLYVISVDAGKIPKLQFPEGDPADTHTQLQEEMQLLAEASKSLNM